MRQKKDQFLGKIICLTLTSLHDMGSPRGLRCWSNSLITMQILRFITCLIVYFKSVFRKKIIFLYFVIFWCSNVKINLKNWKIYYFNIFLNHKYFKKQLLNIILITIFFHEMEMRIDVNSCTKINVLILKSGRWNTKIILVFFFLRFAKGKENFVIISIILLWFIW